MFLVKLHNVSPVSWQPELWSRNNLDAQSSSASISTLPSHPVIDATRSGSQEYSTIDLIDEPLGRAGPPSAPTQVEGPPRILSASGKTSGDDASRTAASSLLATGEPKPQQTFSLRGHYRFEEEADTMAPDSFIPAGSDTPAWRCLISRALLPYEVIHLIEAIFTSEDEVKMIFGLSVDESQPFVDAIHEVRFTFLPSGDKIRLPSFSRLLRS